MESQHSYKVVTSSLESKIEKSRIFDCPICYVKFDFQNHVPIVVCINFNIIHSLCRQCVENKVFKKDEQIYQCSLCSKPVLQQSLKGFKKHEQLLEWIDFFEKFKRKYFQDQNLYQNYLQQKYLDIKMLKDSFRKQKSKIHSDYFVVRQELNELQEKYVNERVEKEKSKKQFTLLRKAISQLEEANQIQKNEIANERNLRTQLSLQLQNEKLQVKNLTKIHLNNIKQNEKNVELMIQLEVLRKKFQKAQEELSLVQNSLKARHSRQKPIQKNESLRVFERMGQPKEKEKEEFEKKKLAKQTSVEDFYQNKRLSRQRSYDNDRPKMNSLQQIEKKVEQQRHQRKSVYCWFENFDQKSLANLKNQVNRLKSEQSEPYRQKKFEIPERINENPDQRDYIEIAECKQLVLKKAISLVQGKLKVNSRIYLDKTSLVSVDFLQKHQKHFQHVQELNLSHNKLNIFDFDSLLSLKFLYLSNNQLISLPKSKLPNLQQLFLNNNSLISMREVNNIDCPSLKILRMSRNKIDSFDLLNSEVLDENPTYSELTHLYIDDNPFTENFLYEVEEIFLRKRAKSKDVLGNLKQFILSLKRDEKWKKEIEMAISNSYQKSRRVRICFV